MASTVAALIVVAMTSVPGPRRPRLAVLLLVGLPLLAAAALLLALWLAIDRHSAVAERRDVGVDDVARAMAVLRTHDPRQQRPGSVNAVALSVRDLDVLLNHAARRLVQARVQVQSDRGRAQVLASVQPAMLPGGRWLNLQLDFVETGGLPELARLRVGRLPLPAALAPWLLRQVAGRFELADELAVAADVIRRVKLLPGQVHVIYAWQADTSKRLLAGLLSLDDQVRLRAYWERLAAVSRAQPRQQWEVSLATLIGPMFVLARERTDSGHDAAAENRAALLALTVLANGRGLSALVPAAREWPQPRPLRIMLGGRDDFPRHLLISAMLAIEGTTPLAKAIGLYKEVADSRSGTGFSFNDLAANRAGHRLGELAQSEPRKLQDRLGSGVDEASLLPPMDGLPEFLPEAEFVKRYGGVGGAGYNELLAAIELRIGALALFAR
jgi:hypothetical protein